MRIFSLILLSSMLAGCFYSYEHYRATTDTKDSHTQRNSLTIKKQDYILSIGTFIHSDDFSIQVSADKSKIALQVDINEMYIMNTENNQIYKPKSHSYWVYNNGINTSNNTDISTSVLSASFAPDVLESKELVLHLSINGQDIEPIKLSKTSIILPMAIN